MPSSLSSIPSLGLFCMPATVESDIAGAGLYNKLVAQAYHSNGRHIFEIGRFWSVTAIFAEQALFFTLPCIFFSAVGKYWRRSSGRTLKML